MCPKLTSSEVQGIAEQTVPPSYGVNIRHQGAELCRRQSRSYGPIMRTWVSNLILKNALLHTAP